MSEDINPTESNIIPLVLSERGYISEAENDSFDLNGAMTIKHIALQKRESSAKHRVEILNVSSLAESNAYEIRPASARSLASRPASAKPKFQSGKSNWKRYLKIKRNSTGLRLIPISQQTATKTDHFPSMTNNLNPLWLLRPSTGHHGGKLPPIKGIASNSELIETILPKVQKHVAFDPTVNDTQRKPLSPRPLSAK
jgi:hypothetical protein